mgnify:CR=1 FL=1
MCDILQSRYLRRRVAHKQLAQTSLSELLALLINTSVFQGAYSANLKLSKVVPVFKVDDAFNANNYRSISLLSNFNRTFEKLIYSRMLSYIEHNDILYTGQYTPYSKIAANKLFFCLHVN